MDGRLLVEGDGVNWFVRANELSSGNRSLMGYPGTGDLIKELEYVRQKCASHLTNQDVQCGRAGGWSQKSRMGLKNRILLENQTILRCIIYIDRAGTTGRLQNEP